MFFSNVFPSLPFPSAKTGKQRTHVHPMNDLQGKPLPPGVGCNSETAQGPWKTLLDQTAVLLALGTFLPHVSIAKV